MATIQSAPSTLLKPRPLHPHKSIVLVPLLPTPPPLRTLPDEIWRRILSHTIDNEESENELKKGQQARRELVRVSRGFKEVVLPLLYARPYLSTLDALKAFCQRLQEGDRKWDNLRRIHHSTPGRWVTSLQLSYIPPQQLQTLTFSSLLSHLFPLTPFLTSLILLPTTPLTRQSMASLSEADCALSLRVLKGVGVPVWEGWGYWEAMTTLLRSLVYLEVLELHGEGVDNHQDDPESIYSPALIALNHLHTISLLYLPNSPILQALLNACLPELKNLTISLYEDAPNSDAHRFFFTFASQLQTLTLQAEKSFLSPSQTPENLLTLCPNLISLSLPTLTPLQKPFFPHPLMRLSIPRPTPQFFETVVDKCFPNLREVKVREVKYLRRTLGRGAVASGSAGILLEWRTRLGRRGVRVWDADGKGGP